MKNVAVLMSGGVDSSVAAALLKEAGCRVTGVTLKLFPAEGEITVLPAGSGISDAQKVAEILDIPHRVIDLSRMFQKGIIRYFCETYLAGRTPNPCVRCNKLVKFGYLLDKAAEFSAAHIATGHYARIVNQDNRCLLQKARDRSRDQSYFLYTLKQVQLSRIIFPLDGLTKDSVRKKALACGFPNANRPDSQEICFIPDNDYAEFIRKTAPEAGRPGPIFNTGGELLGRHKGLAFYTVGQREGLGVSKPEPLYIIRIEPERNALIVGGKSEVFRTEFQAESVNWINGKPSGPIEALVRIRYRNRETPAEIEPLSGETARIKLREPQFAVTPGQSAVFYDSDTVLGGGIIA